MRRLRVRCRRRYVDAWWWYCRSICDCWRLYATWCDQLISCIILSAHLPPLAHCSPIIRGEFPAERLTGDDATGRLECVRPSDVDQPVVKCAQLSLVHAQCSDRVVHSMQVTTNSQSVSVCRPTMFLHCIITRTAWIALYYTRPSKAFRYMTRVSQGFIVLPIPAFTLQPHYRAPPNGCCSLRLHTEGWPGWVDLNGWLHTCSEINFPAAGVEPSTPLLTGRIVQQLCWCDQRC